MRASDDVAPAHLHPVISLLIILATVFIGFAVIGPLLGVVIASPFYEGGLLALSEDLLQASGNPALKVPLYIIQGSATFFGLVVAPAALLLAYRKSPFLFFRSNQVRLVPVVITGLIIIVFMVVNSVFIEWNSTFNFPEFMHGFEQWARESEDRATELTEFLTKFDNDGQFLIALLVIAVLPAIGEELVFRGLIQNEFYRGTGNAHVSIWVSAFLFSAIHMQFFGFIPRLWLGGLFGYLYYWSGSLSVAMIAHFFNNALSVIGLYFYQKGTVDYDLESNEAAPWYFVLGCAAITAVLLYMFKKYYQDTRMNAIN